MSALSIQPPFPVFTDLDGQPLEDGYIYIGTANLPAVTNPLTVYWNAALTNVAVQPIRTQGGYPVNSGTPARLYVNSDYSIQVQNKKGSVVYSAPAATERYGNIINLADITFIQAGAGAVSRTALSKMRDWFSVLDFGADPTGIADSTSEIQAAIAAVEATGKSGTVFFPAGTYKCDSGITIDASVCTLLGSAATLDFSSFGAGTGAAVTITGAQINYFGNPYFNGVNVMQGFKIAGPGSAVAGNTGVRFTGSTALLGSNDYALRDCEIYSFTYGIVMGEVAYHLLFDHCSVFLCAVAVTGEYHVNTGARNVFHRCTIYNSDYGFALYNASASTDITDCVIAGISLVCIVMTSGHLCVTNCDFEPGGSHGANYRTLWVTHDDYPSYSYINWHGNQVSVKNATTSPIYGIDGAAILTITGGYLYANPSSSGGVFGSTGTGTGQIATFNWTSDFGSNPITSFAGASIETYIHKSFTNSVSAADTAVAFGTVEAYTGVISRNGVYGNNNNSVTVAALSTFTSIGVATANGLLVVRDGTLGGTALFLCDASSGVTSVSNTITGLTCSYSGGQLGFTLGSGTVPRTLRWTMVQTAIV